jgi:hypothetical protein
MLLWLTRGRRKPLNETRVPGQVFRQRDYGRSAEAFGVRGEDYINRQERSREKFHFFAGFQGETSRSKVNNDSS